MHLNMQLYLGGVVTNHAALMQLRFCLKKRKFPLVPHTLSAEVSRLARARQGPSVATRQARRRSLDFGSSSLPLAYQYQTRCKDVWCVIARILAAAVNGPDMQHSLHARKRPPQKRKKYDAKIKTKSMASVDYISRS